MDSFSRIEGSGFRQIRTADLHDVNVEAVSSKTTPQS